ncbi:MAG TPA: right-handed parallel beta-helix repeat-containing protein [Candidatus Manganitrophaceae bacterium]|nr:right-handed parallel beta-helix repeat-containing protein [Candidatus Manganitrophaceae bacterium]
MSRFNRLVTMILGAVIGAAALFLPGSLHAGNSSSHAPILIQSDSDFLSCGCVTGGSGTPDSPYIIGPWSINNASADAVRIDGTHLSGSFVLYNLTIAGSQTGPYNGIVLKHINPAGTQKIIAKVIGSQTSIINRNIGILVDSSSYVTLDGGGANPNGAGIISPAGAINQNISGAIDIENSSNVTVTGWQMSANGQDQQPDWITLDPALDHWGVGGVRLFGVTHSLIDHNAANNCTSISYSLFNSSGNTVSNNTADYPFVANFIVSDGSSNNILTGNVAGTGDFFGILVADPLPNTPTLSLYGSSHDNLINNNISHSNGPTGNEIKSGTSPAFLGGIAILNGTYNNKILNNQDWSSTGGDLVWAQVVPDSTSAIGVVTYPPILHCNVTASEGGGGIAKLNGNVWSGNSAKLIDPCIPAQ